GAVARRDRRRPRPAAGGVPRRARPGPTAPALPRAGCRPAPGARRRDLAAPRHVVADLVVPRPGRRGRRSRGRRTGPRGRGVSVAPHPLLELVAGPRGPRSRASHGDADRGPGPRLRPPRRGWGDL